MEVFAQKTGISFQRSPDLTTSGKQSWKIAMPIQMDCYGNQTVPFTEQRVSERYFKRQAHSPLCSSPSHQYNRL